MQLASITLYVRTKPGDRLRIEAKRYTFHLCWCVCWDDEKSILRYSRRWDKPPVRVREKEKRCAKQSEAMRERFIHSLEVVWEQWECINVSNWWWASWYIFEEKATPWIALLYNYWNLRLKFFVLINYILINLRRRVIRVLTTDIAIWHWENGNVIFLKCPEK